MTPQIARWLVGIGVLLVVVGGAYLLVPQVGRGLSHLGRLPGDIRWDRGPVKVYVPLMTSLLLSLLLSAIMYLWRRWS